MTTDSILDIFAAVKALNEGKIILEIRSSDGNKGHTYKKESGRLGIWDAKHNKWHFGVPGNDSWVLNVYSHFKIVDDPYRPIKFTLTEVLRVEEYTLTKENAAAAFQAVKEAHDFAIDKYPTWPINVFVGNNIIGEEFGEALKAALDTKFKGHPLKEMLVEHAQAAAMHVRQLQHLMNVDG